MKPKNSIPFVIIATFVMVMGSCNKLLPPAPASEDVLAEPIAGLTSDQLKIHIRGDEEFARAFSEKDGLGPIFVQASCESCHVGDGKGSPINALTRFGRYESDNLTWDAMIDQGGPQLQHRSISGYAAEEIPDEATGITQFIAPNVTGMGYLEAVPDSALLAMEDPTDIDNDGISGRVHWVNPPDFFQPGPDHVTSGGLYIGRFGRKASAIDLLMQTVGAYTNDMGITSDFDMQDPINAAVSDIVTDGVPDPEVPASTVQAVVQYLQTLEAPRRRNETDGDVKAGEQLFLQAGCENCHTATLKTGKSEIAALNEVEFHPYTDLLLHDMGDDLNDQYKEGNGEPEEWRTTPLWGLGLQQESQGGQIYLMHDGRAATYDDAIQLHGGEAAESRDNYNKLSEADKNKLKAFLNSL